MKRKTLVRCALGILVLMSLILGVSTWRLIGNQPATIWMVIATDDFEVVPNGVIIEINGKLNELDGVEAVARSEGKGVEIHAEFSKFKSDTPKIIRSIVENAINQGTHESGGGQSIHSKRE